MRYAITLFCLLSASNAMAGDREHVRGAGYNGDSASATSQGSGAVAVGETVARWGSGALGFLGRLLGTEMPNRPSSDYNSVRGAAVASDRNGTTGLGGTSPGGFGYSGGTGYK